MLTGYRCLEMRVLLQIVYYARLKDVNFGTIGFCDETYCYMSIKATQLFPVAN